MRDGGCFVDMLQRYLRLMKSMSSSSRQDLSLAEEVRGFLREAERRLLIAPKMCAMPISSA